MAFERALRSLEEEDLSASISHLRRARRLSPSTALYADALKRMDEAGLTKSPRGPRASKSRSYLSGFRQRLLPRRREREHVVPARGRASRPRGGRDVPDAADGHQRGGALGQGADARLCRRLERADFGHGSRFAPERVSASGFDLHPARADPLVRRARHSEAN